MAIETKRKKSERKKKEGNAIFNDTINRFLLRLYGVRHNMVKDHSVREETRTCHYVGYSFGLTARVLLHPPSHRQDSTYNGLCYASRGPSARIEPQPSAFQTIALDYASSDFYNYREHDIWRVRHCQLLFN